MSVRPGYPVVLTGPDLLTAAVVGGGVVGTRKVLGLLAGGARVAVIAPDASDELRGLARSGRIEWARRPYRTGDLDGFGLAFAATSVREVNRRVADDARASGLLCNVADAPEEGTFIVPATHRTGDLLVAVGTGGASPARAAAVRDRLASLLDQEERT